MGRRNKRSRRREGEDHDTNRIDLHCFRHAEVERVLIRKIEDLWGSDEELHIITGNSERMKQIVIKILEEYHLEYKIGDFSMTNMGFIRTVV